MCREPRAAQPSSVTESPAHFINVKKLKYSIQKEKQKKLFFQAETPDEFQAHINK